MIEGFDAHRLQPPLRPWFTVMKAPRHRRFHTLLPRPRAAFEPLEARHLLSASGPVEPLSDVAIVRPVIDLNGTEPGTSFRSTVPLSAGVISFVDGPLSIEAVTSHLSEVRVRVEGPGLQIPPVDTSGTNIVGFWTGVDYALIGPDTVANFETVLRRVQISSETPGSSSGVVSAFARDAHGVEGPQTHHIIEFVDQPQRVAVHLSGSGLYDGRYIPGGPPVAVPGLAGVTIDAAGQPNLSQAVIGFGYGAGLIEVDTTGTAIHSQWFGDHLRLTGDDTVANYEKVLRTAVYSAVNPPPVERVAFITQVWGFGPPSDPAFSQLAIALPAAPAIDLNGDAPGVDYAPDFYLGIPGIAVVDPEGLSIDFPADRLIDGALITLDSGGGGVSVDTSGTNINVAVRAGELELFGSDTVANYEHVLATARIGGMQGPTGGTTHIRFKLLDHELGYGPTATSTLTLRLARPPVVDLNGAAPGEDYVTSYLLNAAVPIGAPDLAIRGEAEHLQGAVVTSHYGQGHFTYDTQGTNIMAMPWAGGVGFSGFDTVENYERVLRTLKVEGLGFAIGESVVYEIHVTAYGQPGVAATARIDVRYPGPPIINFGTGSPGVINETTYYLDGPPVPVLPPDFSVAADVSYLDGAQLAFAEIGPAAQFAVDTSGTSIEAFYTSSGLQLQGRDTLTHYEQVLRSATVAFPFAQPGSTRQIQTTVHVDGFNSPPVTTLVRVMFPPRPVVDLNGDAPGRNITVASRLGGPAASLVDPGLKILAPGVSQLMGLNITGIDLPSGLLEVSTEGKGIGVAGGPNDLRLIGLASIEDYEQVLRTLRLVQVTPTSEVGRTFQVEIRAIYLDSNSFLVPGSFSVSSVTYLDLAPPQVDINGPLPGNTIYVDYALGGPPVPLAPDLVIAASPGVISEARVKSDLLFAFTFDTSGTGITASYDSEGLILQGVGSTLDYQNVLRSLKVSNPINLTGGNSFEITVTGVAGTSAPVNSVVSTLAPLWAVADLNGPEPGTNDDAVVRLLATGQYLFLQALDIASPYPTLQGARIELNGPVAPIQVDTTGTSIGVYSTIGHLELFGIDTVENYERVLRSARFESAPLNPGQPLRAEVFVDNAFLPSLLFLTVIEPPGALLDLSGSVPYEHYQGQALLGGPPVPLVDPLGASILAPTAELSGLEIRLSGAPGQMAVDTSGTTIGYGIGPDVLHLHGLASVADYERVLRTITFQAYYVETGLSRADIVAVDVTGRRGPAAQSFIEVSEPVAFVLGRQLFYNNSKFDGFSPWGSHLDDAAIAPDKSPLTFGSGIAQPHSISSYSSGINGLMIDVANLGQQVSIDDFAFKVGTSSTLANWQAAPPPYEFFIRRGEGANGSDRIVITWPDGAIKNTWLQVIVEGNDEWGQFNTNTKLSSSDVFFFGSRVGDVLIDAAPNFFLTNATDEILVRTNPGFQIPLSNTYDFNRDGLINASDSIIARMNAGLLARLNLPFPGPFAALAAASPSEASQNIIATALAKPVAITPIAAPALVAEPRLLEPLVRSTAIQDATQAELAARATWQTVAAALADWSEPEDEEAIAL